MAPDETPKPKLDLHKLALVAGIVSSTLASLAILASAIVWLWHEL